MAVHIEFTGTPPNGLLDRHPHKAMSAERARVLDAIHAMLRRPPWPKDVRLCGRRLAPPPLSHVVGFPRLEIPLGGDYENEGEFEGNAKLVSIKPGSALFAPPHCWNRPTWRRPVRVLSVLFGHKHLGFSLVTSAGNASGGMTAEKSSIAQQLGGAMFRITEALGDLNDGLSPPEALPGLVRSLLYLVRWSLEHPPLVKRRSAVQRFELISVYLQSHYQQEITRDRVAEQFGISPNHLSRLFRSSGHMKFNEYLTHVRTDRAKFLLRNYPMRIDEISRQCGYNDTAYFCRVFRRVTKCTPGDYRRQVAESSARDPARGMPPVNGH
jgi:AraC-like DNA-binding protein